MVHSTFAQGHVMGGREPGALYGGGISIGGIGIPKSPSFHSGLDLAASASVDSISSALSATTTTSTSTVNSSNMVITPTEQRGSASYFHRNSASGPSIRLHKYGVQINANILTLQLPNLTGF